MSDCKKKLKPHPKTGDASEPYKGNFLTLTTSSNAAAELEDIHDTCEQQESEDQPHITNTVKNVLYETGNYFQLYTGTMSYILI